MLAKIMSKAVCVALVAGAAITATAAAASAETSNGAEARSVHVSYADLNLGSEAGARAMYTRLSGAAHRACGDSSGRMSITEAREIRECVSGALDRAVAALDQPTVTALYEREYGVPRDPGDVQVADASR